MTPTQKIYLGTVVVVVLFLSGLIIYKYVNMQYPILV